MEETKGNEGRWLQAAEQNQRSQWKNKRKEMKEDEMNAGNDRAKRDHNGRSETKWRKVIANSRAKWEIIASYV
jgi:hypothetical protein